MTENMKKFLEFVTQSPEVMEKAKALQAEGEEAVKAAALAFAKEHGFALTEEDFEAPEGELSEKELAGVAGGGSCFCLVGGGGTEGGNDGVCACVGYGQGNVIDNPSEEYKNKAGYMRCICIVGGDGSEAEHMDDPGTGHPIIV